MISPLERVVAALAVGLAILLGSGLDSRVEAQSARARTEPGLSRLTPTIYVAGQIGPDDLARLRSRVDIRTVIALRPDGEAAGQPSSEQMAAEARKQELDFAYVPTPNGAIPATVVARFEAAMSSSSQPVLLYCRSGSRAARVWALSEASRPGGMDAPTILAAVRAAGLSADAEKAEIEQRIAARKPQ